MQRFLLIPVCVFAIAILAFYTRFLTTDPYSRIYTVRFKKVSGLKIDDRIEARGVSCGKVAGIELNPENQSVTLTLKVVPALEITKNHSALRVVAANAFGSMKVEIEPGEEGESYQSSDLMEGSDPDPSQFAAALRSRDPSIQEAIDDLARSLAGLEQGNDTLGVLLYDRSRAADADQSAEELVVAASGFERSLLEIDRGEGSLGPYLADRPEAIADLRRSIAGARQGLADARDGGRSLNRSEGSLGRALKSGDLGLEARQSSRELADQTRDWAAGKGLGAWLVEDRAVSGLADSTKSLANSLRSAQRGEGTLGSLLGDAGSGRDMKESFSSLSQALREQRPSASGAEPSGFLRDPILRDDLDAILERVKELTADADEALRESVDAQPVNTIHGAVFSVF